jgi:hypothetical protein
MIAIHTVLLINDSFIVRANCLCTDLSVLQSAHIGSSIGTEVERPSREADLSPPSRAQGLCLLYFFEHLTPHQCCIPVLSIVIPLDCFYALKG